MSNWNKDAPIPKWIEALTDEEVVAVFHKAVNNGRATHLRVGRTVRDLRKRLYKILIDGLAANQAKKR